MSNVTTPGVGTVLAAGQLPDGSTFLKNNLVDSAGADQVGVVGTNPDANSLLGRLKAIATAIASLITGVSATASADDVLAVTPSDTVALATVPKALLVTGTGNLAIKGAGGVAVTLAVTAGQIVPIRARYVMATNTTATVVALV